MNKSLKERAPYPFVQAHRKSGIYEIFKKFGSQTNLLSHIRSGAKKCGSYVLM